MGTRSTSISGMRRKNMTDSPTKTTKPATSKTRARGFFITSTCLNPFKLEMSLRRGARGGLTKFADTDSAIVGRQEVHEAAIVTARHPEPREHRLVTASRLPQAAPNELAQIVARDVASQK